MAADEPESGEEVLRLSNCPTCDYSLAMLPPQGICPECGSRYDQSFLVLSGRGRGRHDSLLGGTWRSFVVAALILLFAAWMFSDMRSIKDDPFLFTMVV